MKRRVVVITVLVLLLAVLGAGAVYRLVRGADAAALLATTIARVMPQVSVEGAGGSLQAGRASGIVWRNDTVRVVLRGVSWRLDTACPGLIRLCVAHLAVDSLAIDVAPSDEAGSAFPLAPVRLPFTLSLADATVGSLTIGDGSTTRVRFEELALRAGWRGSLITVESLRGRLGQLRGDLAGDVDLSDHLPLRARGRLTIDGRDIAIEASTEGDLRRLRVAAESRQPWPLHAEGWIEPLGQDAPLALTLRAEDALLPWPGQPESLRISTAELRVEGNTLRADGRLVAALQSDLFGDNTLEAELAGGWQQLELRAATLEGAAGKASASGRLALEGKRSWQLDARLAGLHAPGLAARVDARVDGELRLRGALAADAAPLDATLDLRGTVNDLPAALSGRLAVDAARTLHLEAVQIASGPNRMQLQGTAGDTLALEGTLALDDLAATVRGASGRGSARFSLNGPRADPSAQGTLEMTAAGWQGWRADAVRVELGGSRGAHRVAAELRTADLAVALECAGALGAERDWQGRCTRLEATRPGGESWRLERAVGVTRAADATLAIEPFCLRERASRLCNTQRAVIGSGTLGGVAIRGEALPLAALARWLPPGWEPDGTFVLQLDARKQGTEALALDARVDAGHLSLALPAAGDTLPLTINTLTASLSTRGDTARLAGEARIGSAGHLNTELTIRGRNGAAALQGTVDLGAIDAGPLLRTLPGVLDARGVLGGHIELEGSVAEPRTRGRIALVDAMLAHERLPEPVSDAVLMVDFDGPDARIGGRFVTSAGAANLHGVAQWADADWQAHLQLDAEQLRMEPLRGSTLTLKPALDITLSPRSASVRGTIDVPSASIDLATVPRTAASVSDDAVEEGEAVPEARFDYSIDVELRLGEAVQFRGFGAEARLTGGLHITRSSRQALGGHGEIRVVDGRYLAYGQRLEVTDGRLLFRGPLSRPGLRIDAVRPIEDEPVTVGVRVRGDAKAPELSVFSRPAMPESRALHYLLYGHAPAAGETSGLAAAGALLSLGAAGGATRVTGSALGKLGIEDFRVSTSNVAGGTEVHLSGYLTPDLYLRYGVSTFDEVNTFRLRYRLTPSVFVEAISGIENAVDFLYSFER